MKRAGSHAQNATPLVASAGGAARESVVWPHRNLLALETLTVEEIRTILDTPRHGGIKDSLCRLIRKQLGLGA